MYTSGRTFSISKHRQPLPKKMEKKKQTDGVIFKKNKAWRQALAILRQAGLGLGLSGPGLAYFVKYKSEGLKNTQ
jgi:hypothetical protein